MPSLARPIAVTLVTALTCVALTGCASRGVSDYAGVVVDDTITLQAPALPMPAVDLDAGFTPGASGAAPPSTRRSSATTVAAITALGSATRVTRVSVRVGDAVRAGAEIARLDSAALDANIVVAGAVQASAMAQVDVLDDALDTVASSRSTLASRRREINSSAAQLASTRATLATQLADLEALLAKVEAPKAGGAAPVPPGGAPTGTVPPGGTPPGGLPDPAQLRAGIAKLTTALAKIDAGLAKVASGRAQLTAAGSKLADARAQLTDIRALARVAADASAVGVQLARYQRELAVIRTPVEGVVVSVVTAGEVLAPGATIAKIRRSSASYATTWVAPDDLGALRVGSRAEVRADWLSAGAGAIAGSVSHISPRAEYPPTSFSTRDVHMTRAVRVEITLSPTSDRPAPPPGAPVDVRFLDK